MTVPDGVAAVMIEHAREAAPDECCGLLIGDSTRITAAIRARNRAEDARRRYLVDPQDHFAALRRARTEGLEVIGAYHSHPRSDAVPSPTDRAEGVAEFLYVIVGLLEEPPAVRAWTWANGNFTDVPLVRIP